MPGSEISDLGVASIEGTWSLTGRPSSSLTGRGADTFTITFDSGHRDENGCVPYAIGDKTGIVCLPGAEDGPQERALPARPGPAGAAAARPMKQSRGLGGPPPPGLPGAW